MDWLRYRRQQTQDVNVDFDYKQMSALILLCLFGFVMLASASFDLAHKEHGNAYYFVAKQAVYFVIALACATAAYMMPVDFWARWMKWILALSFFLLVLVLFIGVEANGGQRWLLVPGLGVTFQPSEMAKLAVILFTASYIVRRGMELKHSFRGLLKPIGVVAGVGFLLILEPDYGSLVFIFVITTGMLFLAGTNLRHLTNFALGSACILSLLVASSSYRRARVMEFWYQIKEGVDPSSQLGQSVVAIGSGSWFGKGLGNGIQKQFYLPEVETDFIFSVIGEELGFIGVLFVVSLYFFIVVRSFVIARYAEKQELLHSAYVAYGIGIWLGIQSFANIAVAMGALPTKGTTLPFISLGGSSLLVFMVSFGILQKIYQTARSKDPYCHYQLKRSRYA